MIKTEAGEKMKEENPVDGIKTIDGQELLRQELEKEGKKFGMPETPEKNMGGLMGHGMGVIIGIEPESGNEIPAGSKPEEVADDIPAMLSEGEYVVPADVVRWHGVKTFEALRCEAKMGMGLMAEDGRIAEVDTEENDKDPEYEIEEKDKPKVDKAEVEVVHAADGMNLMPEEDAPEAPATPETYYGYTWKINPQTNRYEMVPIDPTTGTEVTAADYDTTRSTRYAPGDVIAREVYGRGLGEETQECPDGFVYDEEVGVCVEDVSVGSGMGMGDGDGGDGPPSVDAPVPYSQQISTQIAEELGPLSAEDLEGYEGATLAEKALSRATENRGVGIGKALGAGLSGPLGVLGLGVKQTANEVGAKRAAMTRQSELGIAAQTLDPTKVGQTYNLSFNPSKAAFEATTSSKITELQTTSSGGSWASDYAHTDSEGNERDPFGSQKDFDAVMDAIDNDFGSLSEVTGASGPSGVSVEVSNDVGDVSTSSTSAVGGVTSTSGQDMSGADGPGSDNDSSSSGESPTGDDTSGSPFAKGGMPVKKNKPKVAMIKYSKGSK